MPFLLPYIYSAVKRFLPHSYFFIFCIFVTLVNFFLVLYKYNASKYKMQSLNYDFIY